MCQFAAPPGYRRASALVSPTLAPFAAIIDAILETDKQVHVKQRHTAVRIRERLRDEHGYGGGYTLVREYVNGVANRQKEVFMPLAHRPGHAQVDFGEADGYIGGQEDTFPLFLLGHAAFGCVFRQGVSDRGHGSFFGWTSCCLRVCRRCTAIYSLRQHQVCGGQDIR